MNGPIRGIVCVIFPLSAQDSRNYGVSVRRGPTVWGLYLLKAGVCTNFLFSAT